MNTEFENGYLLGLASGGVVDTSAKKEWKHLEVTENGEYEIYPEAGSVLSHATVNVDVPVKEEVSISGEINKNGEYSLVPEEGKTFSRIDLDVAIPVKEEIDEELSIISNGIMMLTPEENQVYSSVMIDVNVENKDYYSLIDRSLSGVLFDTKIKKTGGYAFCGCTNITVVNLPEVTSLGLQSFGNCRFSHAILPSVERIYSGALSNNPNLVGVELNSLVNMGAKALQNASALARVDLPAVAKIEAAAFDGCASLETVIIRSSEVCILDNVSAFSGTPVANGNGYLYVPEALVDSYKVANNWSSFAEKFRAIEDYPDITEVSS